MSHVSLLPDQIDAHHLLVNVASARTTNTYQPGQKIYRQGDAAEFVCFVQYGCVELTFAEGEVETVLGRAREGYFFGGTCLHNVTVRIASATAMIDSRITSVTKGAILSAIRDRPRFAKMFNDHLWYNNTSQKDLLEDLLKLAEVKSTSVG